MSGWAFLVGVGALLLLWLLTKWLYFGPAERSHKMWIGERLDEQGLKRGGAVKVTQGTPTLTISYKGINIDLSTVENGDELYREHTYARFRTGAFTDKEVTVLRDSKDLLLKPLGFGARLEIADEKFSSKYIVAGNDSTFANGLLTQGIREKLLETSLHVKFGRRTDSSILSRERGWLSVFTQGMSANADVLDGLIETAILFYERLESLNSQDGAAAGSSIGKNKP